MILREFRRTNCLLDGFNGPSNPTQLIEELRTRKNTDNLNVSQFEAIVRTKRPATWANYKSCFTIKKVNSATKLSFLAVQDGDDQKALSELLNLRGIGPSIASAILSWTHDDLYPVIDRHAWRTWTHFELGERKVKFTHEDYPAYVQKVRSYCKELIDFSITPQRFDFWMYAYSKVFFGPLNGSLEAAE